MEQTIGLIAAMNSERDALRRCVRVWKRSCPNGLHMDQFQAGGRVCRLITTGMGIPRSRKATQVLLEAFHPKLLLSFGIAGAVRPDLGIGDVVLGEQTCRLENGLPGQVTSLASLSSTAREAVGKVVQLHKAHLYTGTTVTTRGSLVQEDQVADLINPILEMETAGIAEAARAAGVPLLVIRSISDGPQSPLLFDLETVLDQNDNIRAGKMIMVLLRHPEIILRSRPMHRNSRTAADRAAIAVMAALYQPGSLLAG
jgi:adenosylhomocysteine nucleosidase